ncbi:hypothetical protein V8E53_000758 [Lactarius tabidus]
MRYRLVTSLYMIIGISVTSLCAVSTVMWPCCDMLLTGTHRLHHTSETIMSQMDERMADQKEKLFYIKGYKVDRDKLLNNFTPRPKDPQNVRMMWLWKKFPTDFLYLGRRRQRKAGAGTDGGSLRAIHQSFYSGDLGQGRLMLRYFLSHQRPSQPQRQLHDGWRQQRPVW